MTLIKLVDPAKEYTTHNGRTFKTKHELEAYILGLSDMALNLSAFSESILSNAIQTFEE